MRKNERGDFIYHIFSPKETTRIETLYAVTKDGASLEVPGGYKNFGDEGDMLESLNWTYDCDRRKSRVKWETTTDKGSYGTCHIFRFKD